MNTLEGTNYQDTYYLFLLYSVGNRNMETKGLYYIPYNTLESIDSGVSIFLILGMAVFVSVMF